MQAASLAGPPTGGVATCSGTEPFAARYPVLSSRRKGLPLVRLEDDLSKGLRCELLFFGPPPSADPTAVVALPDDRHERATAL